MSRITGPIQVAGSILKHRVHICAFFKRPDEVRACCFTSSKKVAS